jgi:hypothetical protein
MIHVGSSLAIGNSMLDILHFLFLTLTGPTDCCQVNPGGDLSAPQDLEASEGLEKRNIKKKGNPKVPFSI